MRKSNPIKVGHYLLYRPSGKCQGWEICIGGAMKVAPHKSTHIPELNHKKATILYLGGIRLLTSDQCKHSLVRG